MLTGESIDQQKPMFLQGAWLHLATFLDVESMADLHVPVHTQRLHATCQSRLIQLASQHDKE